ncbi:MAG: hypothetical protein JKX76_00985 [Colwellia sp.]|nr:hypothetical protein [Colwellia sp.]
MDTPIIIYQGFNFSRGKLIEFLSKLNPDYFDSDIIMKSVIENGLGISNPIEFNVVIEGDCVKFMSKNGTLKKFQNTLAADPETEHWVSRIFFSTIIDNYPYLKPL